jgi:hypothetical protein
MKLGFFVKFSKKKKKHPHVKFHENFSSGREPSCSMQINGRADRQTDKTKVKVAFRDFANAPNNQPVNGV